MQKMKQQKNAVPAASALEIRGDYWIEHSRMTTANHHINISPTAGFANRYEQAWPRQAPLAPVPSPVFRQGDVTASPAHAAIHNFLENLNSHMHSVPGSQQPKNDRFAYELRMYAIGSTHYEKEYNVYL